LSKRIASAAFAKRFSWDICVSSGAGMGGETPQPCPYVVLG
jgi:hypothetical protein